MGLSHHPRWRRLLRSVCLACALAPVASTPQNLPGPQVTSPQLTPPHDEDDGRLPPDAWDRARPEAYVTGDHRIDALLTGDAWPVPLVTWSFYSTSVFGGSYYGAETGVREVSEGTRRNVRALMAWCGTVLGIDLVEVAETPAAVGQIRFMLSDNPTYAYTYYPTATATFHVAGDVHLSPAYDGVNNTNGFQQPPGSHGYLTLLHEIGHALGLKHPHAGAPTMPQAEDSLSFTVMSYQFLGWSPGTLMPYDFLALQYLYGARKARTGNDTYVFTRGTLDQFSLSGQLHLDTATPTKQTIWDTGGTNTIDLSALPWNASGNRLDLSPLGWLSAWSDYRANYFVSGTALGPGVVIQRVINSLSDDTIYANAADNVFAGYAPARQTGRDVIVGATRADTLDLSAFSPSDVREIASGPDLVLSLGGANTITLKDYFTADPPVIAYGPVLPPAPLPPPVVVDLWVATVRATTESSGAGPVPVVELTVVGDAGQPVPGVKISAKWGGMIRATQVGITDADGRVVFRMKPLRGPCTITFNVASATRDGFVHNPDRGIALPVVLAVK